MKQFVQPEVEEESSIDITPMLDVVFIMLIFFIVTATFVKEAGIDVNRPDAGGCHRVGIDQVHSRERAAGEKS